MDEPASLEGWVPAIPDVATLARVVDRAFDYRGDVTLCLRDGTERVGFVFNRDLEAPRPFLQLLPAAGGAPERIPLAAVQAVAFTGRDTAAGNSYAAWLRLKEQRRTPSPGG